MMGYVLPLTQDPWQVMTLDLVIDDEAIHAQVEIRYLPAPDQWVISIWDHAKNELLVNMISTQNKPHLQCICEETLYPFYHSFHQSHFTLFYQRVKQDKRIIILMVIQTETGLCGLLLFG